MHPIVSYYMDDNARYVSQPGDNFSASGLLAPSSILSAVKSSTFRRKLATQLDEASYLLFVAYDIIVLYISTECACVYNVMNINYQHIPSTRLDTERRLFTGLTAPDEFIGVYRPL